MAGEITQQISLQVTKNGATATMQTSVRVDMTGDGLNNSTQSIATSATLIDLTGVTGAPGNFAIRNLDATNYIEIGGDSGLTVFKIKLSPGQSCMFQPSSGTIYAKANTAAVLIQKLAIDA